MIEQTYILGSPYNHVLLYFILLSFALGFIISKQLITAGVLCIVFYLKYQTLKSFETKSFSQLSRQKTCPDLNSFGGKM